MDVLTENMRHFIERGGWVMWPLAFLSVVSLTLIFERAWFWLRNNHSASLRNADMAARLLRTGKISEARVAVGNSGSLYRELIHDLLGEKVTEASIVAALQRQQRRMVLFMPALGTIITASPMLGILGTVTGIISAFQVLGQTHAVTDPSQVGSGIAEALLTTVAGLVIALTTLFPYNLFKGQFERTRDRLDMLVAAVQCSSGNTGLSDVGSSVPAGGA